MTYRRIIPVVGLVAACSAVPAIATPLTLTGNYIEVGISDFGTLGSDGSTSPGLLHDPTGKGNFGINDYLTPGTPHEGFSLSSDQFSFAQSDNSEGGDFGSFSPTLLTGAAAKGYAEAASWTGSNGSVNITNSYFFNPGDERILVNTSITAITAQTDLAFARSLDPDPDANTFGDYATDNQRGNTLYSKSDFVGAAGGDTGLTVALVNLSGNSYTHNTEIGDSCCSNMSPVDVLTGNGVDSNSADDSINLAYLIGNLGAGETADLSYSYSLGTNIAVVGPPVGPPPTSSVPETGTWMMMILGFGAIGGTVRRAYRRSEEKFTRKVRSLATV